MKKGVYILSPPECQTVETRPQRRGETLDLVIVRSSETRAEGSDGRPKGRCATVAVIVGINIAHEKA